MLLNSLYSITTCVATLHVRHAALHRQVHALLYVILKLVLCWFLLREEPDRDPRFVSSESGVQRARGGNPSSV